MNFPFSKLFISSFFTLYDLCFFILKSEIRTISFLNKILRQEILKTEKVLNI